VAGRSRGCRRGAKLNAARWDDFTNRSRIPTPAHLKLHHARADDARGHHLGSSSNDPTDDLAAGFVPEMRADTGSFWHVWAVIAARVAKIPGRSSTGQT
jgi:hypothetical protein